MDDPSRARRALLHDFDNQDVLNDTIDQEAPGTRVFHDDLPIRRCMQLYRPAIFWSLIVSTCVIMEGYDTILMGPSRHAWFPPELT